MVSRLVPEADVSEQQYKRRSGRSLAKTTSHCQTFPQRASGPTPPNVVKWRNPCNRPCTLSNTKSNRAGSQNGNHWIVDLGLGSCILLKRPSRWPPTARQTMGMMGFSPLPSRFFQSAVDDSDRGPQLGARYGPHSRFLFLGREHARTEARQDLPAQQLRHREKGTKSVVHAVLRPTLAP